MSRKRREIDTESYAGRFAVHLRSLREKKGLSVAQLAEKSGISEFTIYAWERVDWLPSMDKLPPLADSLGVKVQKLFPDSL